MLKHIMPKNMANEELQKRIDELQSRIDKVGYAGRGTYWAEELKKCKNEQKRRAASNDQD